MAMDYGALAEGLQRGFSIGMSFVDMENRKKQQGIENERYKQEREDRQDQINFSKNMQLYQMDFNKAMMFANAGLPEKALAVYNERVSSTLDTMFPDAAGQHKLDIWPEKSKEYWKVLKLQIDDAKKSGTPLSKVKTDLTSTMLDFVAEGKIAQEDIPDVTGLISSVTEPTPEDETSLKIDAFEKTFGRKPNENEKKIIMGLRQPEQQPTPPGGDDSQKLSTEMFSALWLSKQTPGAQKQITDVMMRIKSEAMPTEAEMIYKYAWNLMQPDPLKGRAEGMDVVSALNTAKSLFAEGRKQGIMLPGGGLADGVNIDTEVQKQVDDLIQQGVTTDEIRRLMEEAGFDPEPYLPKKEVSKKEEPQQKSQQKKSIIKKITPKEFKMTKEELRKKNLKERIAFHRKNWIIGSKPKELKQLEEELKQLEGK